MIVGRTATASAALMLVLAVPAAAAPQIKHAVWTKAVSVYTAQARAHKATATCTKYSPSASLTCDFGAKGHVLLSYSTTPCVFNVLVVFGWQRTPSSQQAEINYCAKRWSATALPAPWTFPRDGTIPMVG